MFNLKITFLNQKERMKEYASWMSSVDRKFCRMGSLMKTLSLEIAVPGGIVALMTVFSICSLHTMEDTYGNNLMVK